MTPWRDDDGTWRKDCPWLVIGENATAVRLHNDWKDGHHAVSTGRAPWLPGPYLEAVHTVAGEVAKQNELARQRAEARKKK